MSLGAFVGRTVVALDLGSSGVRAVQVTIGRGAPAAKQVAFAPLPHGAVVNGEIVDDLEVAEVLKSLWATHKFRSKQVVFSVANDEVLVRPVDLEWMPPAEFRKALRFLVTDQLPTEVENLNLDYHILAEYDQPNPDGEGSKRMVRILLAAGTNKMIDRYVKVIRAAGLAPVKADLLPFPLIRATSPAPAEPGHAEAIVEIGGDVTTVIIHQAGQPRFVRIIMGLGGNAITDAIVSGFGTNRPTAEAIKIEHGLSSRIATEAVSFDDSAFGVDDAYTPAVEEHPAQPIINAVAARLITEIRTSLVFFLRENTDVTVMSRLVLSGGGSLLGGLAQRLSSELRLPVEYISPLQSIALRAKAGIPAGVAEQQLSVVAGLALGESQ